MVVTKSGFTMDAYSVISAIGGSVVNTHPLPACRKVPWEPGEHGSHPAVDPPRWWPGCQGLVLPQGGKGGQHAPASYFKKTVLECT